MTPKDLRMNGVTGRMLRPLGVRRQHLFTPHRRIFPLAVVRLTGVYHEPMTSSLKAWRIASNLSQSDVAVAIGVSQQTVSSYETGRKSPSLLIASRLSDLSNGKVGMMSFVRANCGEELHQPGAGSLGYCADQDCEHASIMAGE